VGLRADFLTTVMRDLPSRESRLEEPNPRWDEVLGGRTGPDAWQQYGRGAGTTCIVAVNGWARSTPGFPADMVVTEPTPAGGGTRMITAFNDGARRRGWLRTPQRGVLPDFRPGDVFNINRVRADGNDGTHVGVVRRVTVAPDGRSMEVETADGGQGSLTGQYAGVNVRTFSISDGPHAIAVHSPASDGWLDRWVAVGGDEADSGAPASDGTLALALAGLGVLVFGAAWLAWGGGWSGPPGAAVDAWFRAAARDGRGDPLFPGRWS
jgi:hypothetical protein